MYAEGPYSRYYTYSKYLYILFINIHAKVKISA